MEETISKEECHPERSAAESRDLAVEVLHNLIGEIPPLTSFGRNDKMGVLRSFLKRAIRLNVLTGTRFFEKMGRAQVFEKLKGGGIRQKGELYDVTASLVRALDGKDVDSAAVRSALIRVFRKRGWTWPSGVEGWTGFFKGR